MICGRAARRCLQKGRMMSNKQHDRFSLKCTLSNFRRYIPLLGNLVSRDLIKRYRRSVLGYIWCVLSPLLVMLIMNFVFSNMFRNNIENFPVYLFVGRMFFNLITDSTNSMSRSIANNGSLMRKTRIPYYIFPTASFCSSIVTFLFSLIAFLIVMIFTQTPLSIHVLAFPLILLETMAFSYGLGLALSQANTFLRDVNQLYNVFTVGWMYLTPLFYPLEALPASAQRLIATCNPAYIYIQQARQVFLYHQWPSPDLILHGCLFSLAALAVGLYAYFKCRDKLILYV